MTPRRVLVYVAVCLRNGKLYFGITSKKLEARIRDHLYAAERPRQFFHRALHKYGPSSFAWLELVDVDSKQAAGEVEKALIRHFGTQEPSQGYNIQPGGQVGYGQLSEATRTKALGHKHSEATRARMSAVHRGRPAWNKGLKLTQEQLQKRLGNQNHLGRKHSDVTRERLRQAALGRKHSEATRMKMRGNKNALGRGARIEIA